MAPEKTAGEESSVPFGTFSSEVMARRNRTDLFIKYRETFRSHNSGSSMEMKELKGKAKLLDGALHSPTGLLDDHNPRPLAAARYTAWAHPFEFVHRCG